jgi:peptidyl-prolyl cis-trans isomerase D
MLEAIRQRSASFLVKLFLVILILSFGSGIWMNWDMIRLGGGDGWAVRIDDVEVPPETVSDEYQREFARIRQITGNRIDSEQARALGLPQEVIRRIVNRTLLDLAATDLRLAIADSSVAQAIQNDRNFQSPPGVFNREAYRQVLRTAGYTERQYEVQLRQDLARAQFVDSIQAGVRAPAALAEAIFRQRNERRIAQVVRIGNDSMPPLPEPDEPALRAFHSENAPLFTAPEYRQVTAVVLRLEDLAKEIVVAEEAVQAAYDERVDEFSEPEKRMLRQMLLADEAAAKRAEKRLQQGADFAVVAAEEAKLAADALDLGAVSKDQLIGELADPVFALAVGGVTEPIRSPLGWHILQVTAIEPAHQRSLADVRQEITRELAREKAAAALADLTNRLEDTLARGATLEVAAAELDLPVLAVAAVDRQGRDPSPAPVPGLPPQFVETAFAIAVGNESLLTEAGDEGYFILRVDEVVPPALRPFETVRPEATQALQAQRRAAAAKEAAEALARRLRDGGEHAAADGWQPITSPPFLRTGEGAPRDWPPALIEALFAAKAGEFVVVEGPGASHVGRVTTIVAADPQRERDKVEAVEREVTQSLRTDVLAELVDALQRRHPVMVNHQVIDRLFERP